MKGTNDKHNLGRTIFVPITQEKGMYNVQKNMFSVELEETYPKYTEHLAWLQRNYVFFNKGKSGVQAFMDKITFVRWQKYFNVEEQEVVITDKDIELFESYAQFNMNLDKDDNGLYKDDITFQAWQFFKLGKNS